MNHLDRARLDRGAQHLHSLGLRAVAELLADLTARVGGGGALGELLENYRRISPAMIRAAGGDRFSPRPLRQVPRRTGSSAEQRPPGHALPAGGMRPLKMRRPTWWS